VHSDVASSVIAMVVELSGFTSLSLDVTWYFVAFGADNPVTETEDYRIEVLIRLPQLETLDKEDFLPDDKQDALAAYEERKEEIELEVVMPDEVFHSLTSNTERFLLNLG